MAVDNTASPRRERASFYEPLLHHMLAAKPTDVYPIEFHHIKALLLHKQYRHCIRACRDVLASARAGHPTSPLYQTFVSFYLALAHDELARIMHPDSKAKIPSFDQAEKFYHDALIALPSPEDGLLATQTGLMKQLKEDMDAFSDSASNFSLCSSPVYDPIPNIDEVAAVHPPSPLPPSQLPRRITSPPSRDIPRDASLSPRDSDVESQGSFAKLRTPTRVLPRDMSQMLLVTTPPNQSDAASQLRPLPRNAASMSLLQPSGAYNVPDLSHTTSYSLLKPVRLGSPARPYAHQQRIAPTTPPTFKSRFPKLSPILARSITPNNICPTIEEDEIVSPMGSESMTSGPSAVSPISSSEPDYEPSLSLTDLPTDETLSILTEHFNAMRIQLHTHLRMLSKARQETIEGQNRSLEHRESMAPQPLTTTPSKDTSCHSFFSLPSPLPAGKRLSVATLDSQALEKKQRVAAGRKRQWARERFRPERYRELAERALSEL